jgi:hypothetical protein
MDLKKKIEVLRKENLKLEKEINKFKKIPIYEEVMHIYEDISKKLKKLLKGTPEDISYLLMTITDISDISNVITGAGIAFAPNVFQNKAITTYSRNGYHIFAPYVHFDGVKNNYYDLAFDGYDYTSGLYDWWEKAVSEKNPTWVMPYYDDLLKEKTISYSMPIYDKRKLLAVLKYDMPVNEFWRICTI